MAIFNDATEDISSEVQRCLNELRDTVRTMPYGAEFVIRFINDFPLLRQRVPLHKLSHVEKSQVSKCRDAYLFFSDMEGGALFWVKHHEDVRKRILKLRHPLYDMDSANLLRWCEGVFSYLKRQTHIALRSYVQTDQQQIYVNAMYDLVEVVQRSDDKARILKYYDYLILLCQKTFLSPQKFEIPYPDVLDSNPIQTGASADVYRGQHGREEVAIKEFRLSFKQADRVKKLFLKEAYITKILQHANIIPFIGIVREPSRLCIVTPWMKNGDVMSYLVARSTHNSLEIISLKKELLEQVADGLHFMHQYGFAHGDLKGGNVLISDNGNALISDFGVATIQADIITTPTEESSPKWRPADIYKCKMALRDGGMSQELAPTLLSRISNFSDGGTSRWMAPERFLPEAYGLTSAKATFESDVFSFAMLAIEMYTGKPPYADITREKAVLSTISGRYPNRPLDMPELVWLIIEHCWKIKSERPSMFNIYSSLALIPVPVSS